MVRIGVETLVKKLKKTIDNRNVNGVGMIIIAKGGGEDWTCQSLHSGMKSAAVRDGSETKENTVN